MVYHTEDELWTGIGWFRLQVGIRTVDLDMCVEEKRRDGEARAIATAVGIEVVEKKEKRDVSGGI